MPQLSRPNCLGVKPLAGAPLRRSLLGVEESSIGARVCALRKKRDWSQEELAHKAGVSVSTVSRTERGGKKDLDTLTKIARALEVDITEVLGAQSLWEILVNDYLDSPMGADTAPTIAKRLREVAYHNFSRALVHGARVKLEAEKEPRKPR